MLKGAAIIIILLLVNISVTSYLIYLIGDFHGDLQSVKAGVFAVKDVWDLTTGSLPAKARVVATNAKSLKSWIKRKLTNNKTKE